MADEEKASKVGTFWGAMLGALVVSLLSSSGVSFGTTRNVEADAQATAVAKSKAVEEKIAAYVNDTLKPELEQSFAAMADDMDGLDAALEECLELADKADKQAYASLLLQNALRGPRAVERALDRADADLPIPGALFEGPPKPRTHDAQQVAKRALPKYVIEQQVAK